MAEERRGDNAPAEAPTGEAAQAETQTVTWEQYKSLQRQLQKANDKLKALAPEYAERSIQGRSNRLEELVGGVVEVLAGSDTLEPEKRSQVEELRRKAATQKEWEQRLTNTHGRVIGIVGDPDWENNPDYAEVQEAWQAGNLEEAVQLALQKKQGAGMTEAEIGARVESAVADRLKERGIVVDTGTATAGAGRVLRSRKDWDSIVPGSEEDKAAQAAVLTAMQARQRQRGG